MPGCDASKAGMICLLPDGRSSLRQLSMVSVTSWAEAAPPASSVVPRRRAVSGRFCMRRYSLVVGRLRASPVDQLRGRSAWSAGPRWPPLAASSASAPARSRGAGGDEHGGLHAPPAAASAAAAVGLGGAGHRGDDARGAAAQLGVVGDDVDHVAVVDVAEPEADQRREHVERDLLGGAGAHAGRARHHLRAGVEQDGHVGERRGAGSPATLAMPMTAAPRARAASARRGCRGCVPLAETQIDDVAGAEAGGGDVAGGGVGVVLDGAGHLRAARRRRRRRGRGCARAGCRRCRASSSASASAIRPALPAPA